MFGLTKIIFILLALTLQSNVFAQSRSKKTTASKLKASEIPLEETYRLLSEKKLSPRNAWVRLNKTKENNYFKPLISAIVFERAGHPILASIYATQAIKASSTFLADDMKEAWRILFEVSLVEPIQIILETLVETTLKQNPTAAPPYFEGSWNYYRGLYYLNQGENQRALNMFKLLNPSDHLFVNAKYQEGMIELLSDKKVRARNAFFAITANKNEVLASARNKKTVNEVISYAHLAIARLAYEEKKFLESIRNYRAVDKNSGIFYEALFEQGWAFFMAGYPNHALGALYGADSSFFKDRFNPESPILAAVTYYWICRYDDGRIALAEFIERYADPIKQLRSKLASTNMGASAAYQLFENHILGVSDSTLGVAASILQTAADADSMMHYRDLFASLIEEKTRLNSRGIFNTRQYNQTPLRYIETLEKLSKDRLGVTYLAELNSLSSQYEQLEEQAQFLYVELLMGKKENLLGRELHLDQKIASVESSGRVKGWGRTTESWRGSLKGEFWWDEVGYYIFDLEPLCTNN